MFLDLYLSGIPLGSQDIIRRGCRVFPFKEWTVGQNGMLHCAKTSFAKDLYAQAPALVDDNGYLLQPHFDQLFARGVQLNTS